MKCMERMQYSLIHFHTRTRVRKGEFVPPDKYAANIKVLLCIFSSTDWHVSSTTHGHVTTSQLHTARHHPTTSHPGGVRNAQTCCQLGIPHRSPPHPSTSLTPSPLYLTHPLTHPHPRTTFGHQVVFVTTTPYDMPLTNGTPPRPAGINMSCVIQYNAIAR